MIKIIAATFAVTFALATVASAAIDYGKSPYEVGAGGETQLTRNMKRADVPNFIVRNGQDLNRGIYDQN